MDNLTISDVGGLFSDFILEYIGSEHFEKYLSCFVVDKSSVVHGLGLAAMLFSTKFPDEYLESDRAKKMLEHLRGNGKYE